MEKMSQDEAVLFENVYLPSFLSKCAELGVAIDESSLEDALQTTALLKAASQEQSTNIIKTASAALKRTLGVDKVEAQQNKDAVIKQASAQLTQADAIKAAMANVLTK